MCEEFEILEHQAAVVYAHRVVSHSQFHAIRHAGDIGRVEQYRPIDIGCGQGSLDGKCTLAIAFETEDLVGHETIEQRERHARQVEVGIYGTFPLRVIGADDGSHLTAVAVDDGIDVMRAIVVRHIHEFRAEVAQHILADCQVVDTRSARHRQLFLRLHHVEVAIEHAFYIRQEGQG